MSSTALIVYDGECIFCQSYVRLVRLRESVGQVDLVDARSSDPRVQIYRDRGYDLNEGMIFDYGGRIYHGGDALHAMSLLSSDGGVANRLNKRIFSNRALATLLYPFLKLGRRATLALRGRKLISPR